MTKNVKVNGVTYSGISSVQLTDADNQSAVLFTLNGSAEESSLYTIEGPRTKNGVAFTNGILTIDGNRVTITAGNNGLSNFLVNVTDAIAGTDADILNKPEWFTLPTGNVTFSVSNITNDSNTSAAVAFKLANSVTTVTSLSTGETVLKNDVVKTATLNESMAIGVLFVFISSLSANTSIEFDVSLLVNGEKYI